MKKTFQPLPLSLWEQCKRVMRHLITQESGTQKLLSEAEQMQIAQAIEQSESQHSGEIAIAIETRLPWSYLKRRARARERAWQVFSKMQVWDTPDNNGILIYILRAERRIEIVADRGLAPIIPPTQWQDWIHQIHQSAQRGQWAEGLLTVIDEISTIMKNAYPLPDEHTKDNRSSNRPYVR